MADLHLTDLPDDIKPAELRARIMSLVSRNGDCWNCSLAPNAKGYTNISIRGRTFRTHRVMWELDCGPIPDGETIDHLCRNKVCINPAHMEVVSVKENNSRAVPYRWRTGGSAKRAICKRGHDLTTSGARAPDGGCLACKLAWRKLPEVKARRNARLKMMRDAKKATSSS